MSESPIRANKTKIHEKTKFTSKALTGILWFGSTTTAVKAQVTSNPGVTPITLTPTDANSGGGEPATAIKLATTQGGLSSATAGAALSIGATVTSGIANAFPFWIRLTNALSTVGTYTDLTLDSPGLTESAV